MASMHVLGCYRALQVSVLHLGALSILERQSLAKTIRKGKEEILRVKLIQIFTRLFERFPNGFLLGSRLIYGSI
jgi:hypothetical protein